MFQRGGSSGGRTSLHSPLDGVEAATRATDVAFEEGDNFGLIVLSRTSETAPSLDGARYLNNGLCTQTAEGVEMPTVKYPGEIGRFLRLLSLPRGVYRGEQFHVHRAERPERRPQLHEQRPDERRTAECCPTADAVELTFSHRLTRLDIELMPGEGFAAAVS